MKARMMFGTEQRVRLASLMDILQEFRQMGGHGVVKVENAGDSSVDDIAYQMPPPPRKVTMRPGVSRSIL